MRKNTPLTKKQILEYRAKLEEGAYMEKAVNEIADKILKASTSMKNYGRETLYKQTEEKKMARLTMSDHLFESLEWLGDRNLKGDDLSEEIRRAEAKCKVAQQIIANNNTILKAVAVAQENGIDLNTVKEKLKLLTE
jgi:hypothetical protein